MADLATTFAQPGSTYRGKPFWAWNGKLEEEELRRQIRVFHRMGLGGAFMHSRVGLDTPYLSDEWMRLVKACIDECETLEMEAWLYDEDRWPSGAAGGLVTRDERYRARELHCRELTPARYRPGKGRLAVFAAQKKGDALTAYRPLKGSGRPKKGEVALVFDVRTQPTSDWYNGASYLDTMNHAAVQRFLTITHQAYADEAPIRKAFGKVVPGIFTDEPNRGGALAQSTFDGAPSVFAPWTDRLPQIFRKRYGYDLLDRLPEVFYDMAGVPVREARYHYHDCTTFLFVDAFARQIGEWCERHRLLHTGHVLAEPTPRSQTRVVGSAMRFYEHMQAPGIDILTEHGRELDTAKQCASVLRQTGRTWMLSELYGCTGWQFPFEGHKAVGDWQAALGVNLRCQHLSWYTMEGQAKRDYPASIFFQSPWWEAYGAVEDYFARLGVLLTQGEAVRDLLVVHPLESTWVRYAQGEDAGKDLDALDQALVRLRNMLLEAHIDYDYGDEEMLDRLGKVRRGKGETPPRLAVGKADYRMVLVPPLRTIRGSTVRLLERFARAGGTVVFVGEGPDHVDAVPGADARDLQEADGVETCVFDPRSLLKAVEPARRVSVLDRRGREVKPVLYQLRTTKEGQILFLCNTDRGKGAGPVRVRLDGRDAEEWDAATGERYRASTARDGDALVIETDLPPGGSRLFVVRDRAVRGLQPRPEAGKGRRRTLDRKRWTIQRSEPNVFVLDRPAWKLDSGAWRKPDEILKIDQACRDHLGLPRRGGRMAQPWTRADRHGGPSARLALRYTVQVGTPPDGPVALAVEQPDRFAITLNSVFIDPDAADGWWVDPSLRRIPLDPALLRPGANELVLETLFREDHGLEMVYLLGEFGVRVRGADATMVAAPRELRVGDWTRQGLPFYSGNVTYACRVTPKFRKGQRILVETPRFDGAAVRIHVDGAPVGVIGWAPHELDITDHVKSGRACTLGIEVLGHRRNSHGPLHDTRVVNRWTGSGEFVTEGDLWTDDYQLVRMGLLAPPKLSVR